MTGPRAVQIDSVRLSAGARRLPGSEALGAHLGDALAHALRPYTEGPDGVDVVIDAVQLSLPVDPGPHRDWLAQVAERVARRIGRSVEASDE